MNAPVPGGYLLDATCVINLLGGKNPTAKAARMTNLAKGGLVRVPAAVIREVKRGGDGAGRWVTRQETLISVDESPAIVAHQTMVLAGHGGFFTVSSTAADPMVVCTAYEMMQQGLQVTVVTQDNGVQVVCHRLGIPILPDRAFRTIHL